MIPQSAIHILQSTIVTMQYVSLHNHSVFSFYAGVPTVDELVAKAVSLGMQALALTDIDRMSGLILFYQACKKAGIKPLLGVELTRRNSGPSGDYAVLLAKNAAGYADLCEIITRRRTDPSFAFEAAFARPWENLVFLAGSPAVLELMARTPNRERLYAEVIDHCAESRLRSRVMERRADELGIPLAASNDVYFVDPPGYETHRLLRAIGLCSTLSRLRPGECAPQNAFLPSHDKMERLFERRPDALVNTARIADCCDVRLDLGRWIVPRIDAPGAATPERHLRRLAWKGFVRRYGRSPQREKARALLARELDVIEKLGYASYFLIVKDVRDWADRTFSALYRKPGDSTILRGSAANAVTFYTIGVSDLDPIEHDLYFERFLNEDRASPPDADLDFGWDEREQALDYMVGRWGRDRVAITCTTNHFRAGAAFRETAKVYGYSEEQITAIMKSHRTRTRRVDDEELRFIVAQAARIRGKPRFLGQHPGGVLVTNDSIRRHVACEYTNGPAPRLITQIDMHNGIDELGLIKFDLLGNGSLSVLRDTLGQLAAQGVPDPAVDDVGKCCADPAVRAMVREGRTRGIFYIESPAQMRLNKKALADTFAEVTVTSSLVRPAGAKYTALYVERHRKAKQGIRDWEFVHPSLEPILRDTHDVCAFQEDVTKICRQVAGLSFKRADKIRKMMNSLHEGVCTKEELDAIASEFMQGCAATNGLSAAQAFELWQRVSSFSGFSFCKSHSASYARLSFKCAYLKAHYPAQFFAAVLSNEHGFYSRDVYLDEARRWGIRVLPMSVNASEVTYAGRHQWLRPGLMHVRGVRRAALEALVAERQRNGLFRNLADVLTRTPLQRAETENLVLVGAFDGFGLTQPELLYQLDGVVGATRRISPTAPTEPSLDLDFGDTAAATLHPGLCDYTLAQRCLNELRLLGYMLSGNVLDILDLHPRASGSVAAADIGRFAGRDIKAFGWPIAKRVHWAGEEQRPMMFLTLEDKTECMDVIVWPDAYERLHDELQESGPYEVWGRVTEDYGTYSLEARTLHSVAWSPGIIDMQRASERLARSWWSGNAGENDQTGAKAA
jgi:DNA-directed DNA polymerase III PolC